MLPVCAGCGPDTPSQLCACVQPAAVRNRLDGACWIVVHHIPQDVFHSQPEGPMESCVSVSVTPVCAVSYRPHIYSVPPLDMFIIDILAKTNNILKFTNRATCVHIFNMSWFVANVVFVYD